MIMKIFIKRLLLFILILVPFHGYAGNIMIPSSPLNSVNNDKALVTFLMSTTMANPFPTFQFEFDIWDSEKFIGALSRYTYFQYMADPGEHLFVARGGNRSFVKANLQAEKKYYVFVNLSVRPFYQNVYFDPVTRENQQLMAEIPSYLNNLKAMTVLKEESDDYIKERIEAVKNEIKVFKSTKHDFSILDLQDGI